MIEANNIEKILERQGFVISPVKGDSMLPMLDENKDAVKIVPAVNVLEKYDLPLYRRPGGQLVLHRIIEVKKKHYIICGDNRADLERDIAQSDIVGMLEGFYQRDKYISRSDKEFLQYAKKAVRTLPIRRMKVFIYRVIRKLKRIISK